MRNVGLLVAGFVVWSAAFIGIYALQATGCAVGLPPALLRTILIGSTVASALACLGVVMVAMRWQGALRISAICAAFAALAASALTFSGVFWMQLC